MHKRLLSRALEYKEKMKEDYRQLHKIAEKGLQLPKTVAFCKERLRAIGYEPLECGGGFIATAGRGEECILLRADMDALPIGEETDLCFAADNGNMHACGHDMHTVMLLWAAGLLKELEGELSCRVRLCFQPGEETLAGAERMINGGLLENPRPDRAVMLHVLTGTDYKTGTLIIPPAGVGAAGADFFCVTIRGEGCHGAAAHLGRDPIIGAAHMLIALSSLVTREFPAGGGEALSVGSINSGNAANAIPDTATFSGTLRSYDDKSRAILKERLFTVCDCVAKAFGLRAGVEITSGCPSFINDRALTEAARALFCDAKPSPVILPEGTKGGGSEDFAYVSRLVPSIMLALCAGEKGQGYTEPLHSPKARFDEDALPYGAAALAAFAFGNR